MALTQGMSCGLEGYGHDVSKSLKFQGNGLGLGLSDTIGLATLCKIQYVNKPFWANQVYFTLHQVQWRNTLYTLELHPYLPSRQNTDSTLFICLFGFCCPSGRNSTRFP